MASNEWLIYYLDIILVICFLIGHWLFFLKMAYIPVKNYSKNNPDNNNMNSNKDNVKYRKMHIANLWWTI